MADGKVTKWFTHQTRDVCLTTVTVSDCYFWIIQTSLFLCFVCVPFYHSLHWFPRNCPDKWSVLIIESNMIGFYKFCSPEQSSRRWSIRINRINGIWINEAQWYIGEWSIYCTQTAVTIQDKSTHIHINIPLEYLNKKN
jgi:hypothetical protein